MTSPYLDKLVIKIETHHRPGNGEVANVHGLTVSLRFIPPTFCLFTPCAFQGKPLEKRVVELIDIAAPVDPAKYTCLDLCGSFCGQHYFARQVQGRGRPSQVQKRQNWSRTSCSFSRLAGHSLPGHVRVSQSCVHEFSVPPLTPCFLFFSQLQTRHRRVPLFRTSRQSGEPHPIISKVTFQCKPPTALLLDR